MIDLPQKASQEMIDFIKSESDGRIWLPADSGICDICGERDDHLIATTSLRRVCPGGAAIAFSMLPGMRFCPNCSAKVCTGILEIIQKCRENGIKDARGIAYLVYRSLSKWVHLEERFVKAEEHFKKANQTGGQA